MPVGGRRKDGRILGGSSRTLAHQIVDKSLRLEAGKTVSEQGKQADRDGERSRRMEGNISVKGAPVKASLGLLAANLSKGA